MTRFWFWLQLGGALCCFASAAIEWRKGELSTGCAWLGCGMWTLPTREKGCRG